MRKTETLRFKTVLSQFNRKEALSVSQIVLSHLSASYGMQEKSESSELLITSMQMSESERESQKRSPRMQKKMLRIQR